MSPPPVVDRVLVVDDDAGLRMLARAALERQGFAVEDAADGIAGLDAFARLRPGIVLLDVVMPGIDGYETCRQLRDTENGAPVPVLMMTGLDDMESITAAYEAGATDFITKPFNWELLAHRVRYMLRASRAISELALSRARLSDAQRVARLGHWEWNIETGQLQWSEETFRIFGLDADAFRPDFRRLVERVHPGDRKAVTAAVEQALADNAPLNLDHRVVLPDGSVRHVHQQGEIERGADGRPLRMLGTLQDITERKLAEEQIRHLAYYDSLTGLPNRRLFHEYLKQALATAQRRQTRVATLHLDLDHFKRINDTLGHASGDRLLRAVAGRLCSNLRNRDTELVAGMPPPPCSVARLGGDEFTVLLGDLAQGQDVAPIAGRIQKLLSQPLELDGHEVVMSASVGIAIYPIDGEDADTLLLNAEAAMYHAKEQGRHKHLFYTRSMNAEAHERLARENALRKALERGELILHYQPQVEARTGRIAGAEALVRWQHPELGILGPGEFIPLAEQTGLILPLGEWVLQQACRQNRAWRDAGLPPVRVAVNMSGAHFRDPQLVARVAGALQDSGLEPDGLELEVTESMLMDVEGALATLGALKAMKLRIAIDDFGTGYSSLTYLKRFPLDALKIDRSFVRELPDNSEDAAIVQAILSMGRALKLSVIAEGVETDAQRAFLAGHGCHELQGYLYSRPIPAAEFEPLLAAGGRYLSAEPGAGTPGEQHAALVSELRSVLSMG